MNSRLQTRSRWQPPLPVGGHAWRWLDWAQALSARYQRLTRRYPALSLRLVQAPVLLYLHCQRWQAQGVQLYPQLRLSIAPGVNPLLQLTTVSPAPGAVTLWLRETLPLLLRESTAERWRETVTTWRRHTVAVPAPAIVATFLREMLTPRQQAALSQQAVLPMLLRHLLHESRVTRDTLTPRWTVVAGGKTGEDRIGIATATYRRPATLLTETLWETPLNRIFRRLTRQEAVTVEQYHLNAQRSMKLLNRLVEAHQRVEEKTRTTTVIRQHNLSAIEERLQKSAPLRTAEQPPAAAWSAGPDGYRHTNPPPAMPPALDLERLTDRVVREIDHRILAHRERLGKVF